MRFMSFATQDKTSWGTVVGDKIVAHGSTSAAGGRTLREVLRDGDLADVIAADAPCIPVNTIRSIPPIPDAEKIICVGLNYADHILEMNRPWPEKPVIFTRFADSLVGNNEALVAPRNSSSFDFEGEFAIIIGQKARHVPPELALNHVFGYTVMNDGSLRDYQRHTHQFAPGKNFPKSGSLGPSIVTGDEFGPVTSQRIRTRVNGTEVQSSTLDQLVFSVADLVSYCSEWTALHPGDVIATGTPGGVGDGRSPALWLFPGDVVEVEVDGIGTLTNLVIEED